MAFYPHDRPAPVEKRTRRLLLRPLTVAHVEMDYDAVMASRAQLNVWSQTTWPTPDFTLAENRADLARHQREHEEGVAFTYTVLEPGARRCLGCVYITPIPESAHQFDARAGYGAKVTFWMRSDELSHTLERHLLDTLRAWLAADWPFDQVVYTISQQNRRQAQLLRDAGLVGRGAITLSDGRACWAYTEPDPA